MHYRARNASRSPRRIPMVQPVRTRNQITTSSHASIWQVEDIHADSAATPCDGCGCSRKTPLRKRPA